jgi:hypothetical protein
MILLFLGLFHGFSLMYATHAETFRKAAWRINFRRATSRRHAEEARVPPVDKL